MFKQVIDIYIDVNKVFNEVGPGKYNTILKSKRNFHVTGGSSVFLSKVERNKFSKSSKANKKNRKLIINETNKSVLESTKDFEGNRIHLIP
jgi:hypothetical protein